MKIIYDGQLYRLVETVAHVRRDGRPSQYHVLETECPDCGAGFTVTWAPGAKFHPNRRCALHRQPRRRIHRVRGRKTRVRLSMTILDADGAE